jgi:TatA/E family protein of Tat protein translocase
MCGRAEAKCKRVILDLGAGKLPQIGENLGKAIRNFKKSTHEREEIDVTPKKPGEISGKA